MKGSRICVSFSGNWWDTLSREQQLLYIEQHPKTTKEARPEKLSAAKKVVGIGRAVRDAAVAGLGEGKKHFNAALSKLNAGEPETITKPEHVAFKRVGLSTGMKMALLFGAAIALGPMIWFAPLAASIYINWKLSDDSDSRGPSLEDAKEEDLDQLEAGSSKVSGQEEDEEDNPESTTGVAEEPPEEDEEEEEGEENALENEAKPEPTTPAKTDVAEKPAEQATAEKAPAVSEKKAKKAKTDEELADEMVEDFHKWLESGDAERLAAEAEADKAMKKAISKSKALALKAAEKLPRIKETA